MPQQKTTKRLVRIASDIDPELVQKIDAERASLGTCSRSVIIRMALRDRYKRKAKES